ncbi:type IV conjugative transfer system coupling protein TraD [Escherichia coli]|nr:type IV conjugative transfer system coupling protein TraD [Escherichia coli]
MSFNAKDMTQGGQIASMRIRMFSQIANIMLYCLFIFFWILVGLVLWVKISWQTFVNGCIYWWCTTLEGMRDLIRSQPVYEIQYYGKTFRMNAAQVLHDKYMIWCGEQLWSAFVLATVVALVICLITFFVVSWILGRQGKQQSENEVTGGRQLTENPKDVARMLKKDGKDSDIRIGDLPIIRDSEIQNFCLHGTVGAGKSEVIRRLANYARQRGDMVVIYDRSGEFVKSYYDPSIDKILNPLDARCAAWDLWKECLTQPDFDNTANTLIPMGTKEDPFWQGSGRTIFAEAAYLMRNDPNRSYSKLVDTLLSIKIEKLRTFLRNSPAANLVEEKIEKTAISIRAVLTNYVKAIRYLQGIEHNGEPFTIRDWMRGVREDQKNGWLFISSNADTHASLKPVISMWLSIAIRGLLAMGENRNRRVWFFCDELLDHANRILHLDQSWMFLVGRGAFPLFALVWGLNLSRHTHIRQEAINRLWGWGVIAQFAYYLAGFPWYEGNILFAFAVAAQVLTWCETRSLWRTAAAILLMALWGPLSGTSYGIAGLLMLAVSHRLYRAEDRTERLVLVACLLTVIPALNLATSDTAAVAGLVMTVLTVGLVSCAGKSLPRFWPGDFFPTFYACHLAVLGVLAL